MAERTIDRLRAAVGRLLGGGGRRSAPSSARPSAHARRPGPDGGSPPPDGHRRYPGDFRGIPAIAYAPKPDGQPDPGEIVWVTWSPADDRLRAAITDTETYIRDQLGDARSFSLDSPASRRPRLEALRRMAAA